METLNLYLILTTLSLQADKDLWEQLNIARPLAIRASGMPVVTVQGKT